MKIGYYTLERWGRALVIACFSLDTRFSGPLPKKQGKLRQSRCLARRSTLSDLLKRLKQFFSLSPSEARTLAKEVCDFGFSGIYVDANAIAPQTASEILADFGTSYVDGGLIGPPARQKVAHDFICRESLLRSWFMVRR